MLNGKQSPEETVKAMADSINKSIKEYNTINKQWTEYNYYISIKLKKSIHNN